MTKTQREPRYTTGGELLRNLRVNKKPGKWSQGILAGKMQNRGPYSPSESEISKVENGYTHPNRAWLESALAALDADYPRYQEVMDAFGYKPRMLKPTDRDIQKAREKVADIFLSRPYPMYLADSAFQILHWNEAFTRLSPKYGRERWFKDMSMIDAMFGTTAHPFRFFELIDNPQEFFPQQLLILYHEWHQAREEDWCKELLERHMQNSYFRSAWEAAEQTTALDARQAEYALRLRVPLRLRLLSDTKELINILSFHVFAVPFVEDRRFRVLGFQPSDTVTMRQCIAWAEEPA